MGDTVGLPTPESLAHAQGIADQRNLAATQQYIPEAAAWVARCKQYNKILDGKPLPHFKWIVTSTGTLARSETDYVCPVIADPVLKTSNLLPGFNIGNPVGGTGYVDPSSTQTRLDRIEKKIDLILKSFGISYS